MRAAKIALIGLTAASMITSAALAQQTRSGMVTKIDRLSGTITIQQTQPGTVGANGGAVQEYKVSKEKSLDAIHAGDRVNFTTTDGNGGKTIDKLEQQ
jgi:Cu/Ag efflux protein CusF